MWYNLKKNLLQSSTLGKLLMVLLLGLSVTLKGEDQFQEAGFPGEGGLGGHRGHPPSNNFFLRGGGGGGGGGAFGGTPHPTIFF